MKKNFVRKKINYERLGDSLSDTQIASLKNAEGGEGDVSNLQQPQTSSTQRDATGDGLPANQTTDSSTVQKLPKPPVYGTHIKIKDEMKIDLRRSKSCSSSNHSNLFNLYPIKEVPESDMEQNSSAQPSKQLVQPDNIQRILEENRVKAQNRPNDKRTINLERDFIIRKPFFASEESVMNSTFGDFNGEAIAKVISASHKAMSDFSLEDSVTSYKRAHCNRIAEESKVAYRSLLEEKSIDNCSNITIFSSESSTSFRSRSSSSNSCTLCCFSKKNSKSFKKSKKNT